MSDKKLNLPAEIAKNAGLAAVSPALPVVDTAVNSAGKIAQAKIEANAKVEVAKLQVWKEAIAATSAFFSVIKSHKELQKACAEWEVHVRKAEAAIKEAEVNLQVAQEQNKPRMEELELSRKELTPLLSLFDEIMKKVKDADLSDEVREEALQHLFPLSDKIVQLSNNRAKK